MKPQNLPKLRSKGEMKTKSIDLDPESTNRSPVPTPVPQNKFQIEAIPFQKDPNSLNFSNSELDPQQTRENPNDYKFPRRNKVAGTIKPSITNPLLYININRIHRSEFQVSENQANAEARLNSNHKNLPSSPKIQSSNFHQSLTYQAPVITDGNSPRTPSMAEPDQPNRPRCSIEKIPDAPWVGVPGCKIDLEN